MGSVVVNNKWRLIGWNNYLYTNPLKSFKQDMSVRKVFMFIVKSGLIRVQPDPVELIIISFPSEITDNDAQ